MLAAMLVGDGSDRRGNIQAAHGGTGQYDGGRDLAEAGGNAAVAQHQLPRRRAAGGKDRRGGRQLKDQAAAQAGESRIVLKAEGAAAEIQQQADDPQPRVAVQAAHQQGGVEIGGTRDGGAGDRVPGARRGR